MTGFRPVPARLRGIGTAVPARAYPQSFALAEIQRLVGDTEAKRTFLERVYKNSGIETRHSAVEDYGKNPADFTFHSKSADLRPETDTKARNDFFVRHATPLALRAVRDLQERSPDFNPARVTHLVTVSCTGFSAPGIDFDLAAELPLRADVERFHVAFMGCFGAFPALRLARSLIGADPEACVLVVCTEICSVHFRLTWDPELQVANALFADGSAAAWLDGSEAPGPHLELRSFASRVAPASRGEMSWTIGEHGFDMRLSSYVPKVLEANLLPLLQPLLDRAGIQAFADVPLWGIHPGGRAILDRTASSLAVPAERLAPSYEVLRDFGNMSSATVLFVLQKILKSSQTGPVLSAAFGPGLTIESALLQKIG